MMEKGKKTKRLFDNEVKTSKRLKMLTDATGGSSASGGSSGCGEERFQEME